MNPAPEPSKYKILVVDDEKQFRSFMKKLLEKSGFEVVMAADGREGLDQVKSGRPDLVLCDLEMPGMNGYEFLARLHGDAGLAGTPVIFLTGLCAPQQVRLGMNLGVDDYLTKPMGAQELISAIKARLVRFRSLNHASARQAQEQKNCAPEQTFLIKTRSETAAVKAKEITRITADGEYTWVHWARGRGALMRKPLKVWLSELPAEQFARIHRGAIINLERVEKVERLANGRLQVWIEGADQPLPVSLRLAAALKRQLSRNVCGPLKDGEKRIG